MLNLENTIKNNIIGKQVLTMSICLKIILKNGKKIAFTTNTNNIKFIEEPDLIYLSKGFTPSVVSQNNQMSVDNADGKMIIDNINILEDDLEKGIYNNAYYELFEIDWTLKTNGYYSYNNIIKGINGTIGEVKRDKLQFDTEFRSLSQYLSTTIIDVYKASCSATLGDIKCGVSLSSFTFNDTISAVIKSNQFIVSTSTNTDGFFNNGIVEFITGQNTGKKYTIKNWDSATKTITLQMPSNYSISIGDNIKLIAGCNKIKSDCKYKFNNYINYRGFYDIPGMDFIVSGGGTKVNY